MDTEVLIVGAGISGIAAAQAMQTRCPKWKFTIVEARGSLGGTWDLFRYPGVRSDSDMYTLGYPFRPWTGEKTMAEGADILEYLRETAREYEIGRKILFHHRVVAGNWDAKKSLWCVTLEHKGEQREIRCRFLFWCGGYYRYDRGYTPKFEGMETFQGEILHPQFWPKNYSTKGKKIVVIGSGATAVSLIPAIAKEKDQVTMLQRSPSYIMALPEQDVIAQFLLKNLPVKTAHGIIRWKNIIMSMWLYCYCQTFPKIARKTLVKEVAKQLPRGFDVEKHFNPKYDPWDERLCFIPNGDLFRSVRQGYTNIVTGKIRCFRERGIELEGGGFLKADVVVTATGLEVSVLGDIPISVDGVRIELNKKMLYRGTMLSEVPNLMVALGYTNASWTLRSDLLCRYFTKVLNYLIYEGFRYCYPTKDNSVGTMSLIPLRSGYWSRVRSKLPHQGSSGPWRFYQNYIVERFQFSQPVNDGVLRFCS